MSSEHPSGDFQLDPTDGANAELLEQVHHEDWSASDTDGCYNMVAVGAETGGLDRRGRGRRPRRRTKTPWARCSTSETSHCSLSSVASSTPKWSSTAPTGFSQS